MLENIIYNIRIFIIRKLLETCSSMMLDYPERMQDSYGGWQFNNRWIQPKMGGREIVSKENKAFAEKEPEE